MSASYSDHLAVEPLHDDVAALGRMLSPAGNPGHRS